MANKIQQRRGLKANMPTGSDGELLYATDTRELFIGTGNGNVNMSGSHWYRGTAMSGTSTAANLYSYSACPEVKLDDIYLNTANGNVYACTTAGKGASAKWTYQGCMKGVKGDKGETGPAGSYFPTNGYASMDELSLDVSDMIEAHLAPPTTITIGCVDSANQWLCDFNVGPDGNADEAFKKAINALPNGGKISILEGEYTITQPLTCNSDIVFEGMGNGTVINVTGGVNLINNISVHKIIFRDMKIVASGLVVNTHGLFNIHSDTELHIDNSNISISITGSSSIDDGTAICNGGVVYCSNTKINADVATSYNGLCYMIFRNCTVYASLCNIAISRTINNSAIFYNSRGTVVSSSLNSSGMGCILSSTTNISICACTVKCYAITQVASARGGEFTGCEIAIQASTCCGSAISNCKLITGSNTMRFSGSIFTNNRVVNNTANKFNFDSYSIVKDNVSKYTLSSTTPSNGKMSDNIVYSSLS